MSSKKGYLPNPEATALWEEHRAIESYPPGVTMVPEPIRGTAFFPGGYGLWTPRDASDPPIWPKGGIMVLGQDFHSEAGYRASFQKEGEDDLVPTWVNLKDVLSRSGVSLRDCFFTNAFMGLRLGHKNIGRFPGAVDPEFTALCASFLARQIEWQVPTVIITLGVYAPQVLARIAPALHKWNRPLTMARIDESGPVRRRVEVPEAHHVVSSVVALTHPSLRRANLRHRKAYNGLYADAAEMAMLADALAVDL